MRLLISSYAFAPSIGGLESVSMLMARAFAAQGHEVIVVTETPANSATCDLPVVRRPGGRELIRLVRWCDVVWHNNISLRGAWPLGLIPRPWVITHQTWIGGANRSLSAEVKRAALRCAKNIAISTAVAATLPVSSRVIANPYDETLFCPMPEVIREGELIFVGRIVPDKGLDVLLYALALLKRQHGVCPRLAIVGSGPAEDEMRSLAVVLGVSEQIDFLGSKNSCEVALLLNKHRVLVVPSRWAEPFGIVALEGIACGCFVVGSQEGGLREAIGPCGVTFPNGDHIELAEQLRLALEADCASGERADCRKDHLKRFRREAVANEYDEVFRQLTNC